MSSNTQPSPPRAGSYILVSSSMPLDDSNMVPDELEPEYRSSRPRLFFLLPLVAALDIALAVTLGILVLNQEAKHDEPDTNLPPGGDSPSHDPIMYSSTTTPFPNADVDDAAWERRRIVLAVIAFSIARASAYAMVGISKRIRQLGVTVAAVSILSTLFYVSVANLLFQARPKPDIIGQTLMQSWWSGLTLTLTPEKWHWPDAFKHIEPTMPILVGAQMAFTLFEWILYIAVVGVKIPPGGNPVEAKRWARGLADDPDYQRGVDAHSLYPSDGEEEEEEEEEIAGSHRSIQNADTQEDDLEQARTLLASPISNLSRKDADGNDASDRPLLGTGPSTPRGYGSTLQTAPRTPQGPSHAHTHSHGSVRSTRSPAAAGMSRSASARSGMYSRSPGAAELAAGQVIEDDHDDEDDEEGDEEDAEGSDPDDIIDITPNRAVARKEARLRLARAALPERRASGGTLSTLNIFGNEAPAKPSGSRGANVFSDEAGSPLGRNTKDQDPPALLSVATSPEVPRAGPALGPAGTSRHSSYTLHPSSSSTRTASTKGSGKERKFRLPRWMKPNKKK
ncbi:uncharacterized protein UTRI_01226_B [Ustilago trichophora]|uniref:Uncharacterized protein n=1 Tax=Ustilago trichophora TaxID=86804 RepID=A0A5C3DVW4_9BASI|nr:uncharacterized protein UTRI_01226_B [Ustilago trichophora]